MPVKGLRRSSASRFAAMDTLRTTTPRTCPRSFESRSPAAIQSSVSRRNSARKPAIRHAVVEEISAALAEAEASPAPDPAAMEHGVYANPL